MVWLKDEPTTATKISQLATVITNNQNGIQNGEVPFVNLRLTDASNPARNDNFSWLFGKDPGTSLIELFFEDNDNPAHVIQMTSGGNLGSSTTNILASQISFNSTFSNNQDSFITAWGVFPASNSPGPIAPSYGKNIAGRTRSSTGVYTIDTNNIFSNANVGVMLTVFSASNNPQGINLTGVPTFVGGVVTIPIDIRDRSGSHDDLAFHIAIMGGVA
ncbi:hypothetical protein UFOVP844_53 [uncultured Caudovirales phage]|uniref:Uncharacterized protein n=1 Tax=uncultured Caudovirales phage TaxID=2100421 RepID=A0A6J5PCH2_9CAUD|nr:hypothetical protein UFOVP844_53 [uncultured Caudovirales phage]